MAQNSESPLGLNVPAILGAIGGLFGLVFVLIKVGAEPASAKAGGDALRRAGFATRTADGPFLGLSVDRIEEGPVQGARVTRVLLDSPAERSGLLAGDIVTRIDRTPITSPADLLQALADRKAGDAIKVTLDRKGVQRAVNVQLGITPIAMGQLAAAPGPTAEPWLGLDIQPIDPMMLPVLGLPDSRGVVVAYVYPGSPAALAGISQGDAIRQVGEVRIAKPAQISDLVMAARPGDRLRLVLWHQGAQRELTLALGTKPPPDPVAAPTLPGAEVEAAWLGLDIVPVTPAEAEELGLPEGTQGMVVDGVAAGAGVKAGFIIGDVILAINGKPTPTVDQFMTATEDAVGAVVDVFRVGRHVYLAVPPPGTGPDAAGPKVRPVAFNQY